MSRKTLTLTALRRKFNLPSVEEARQAQREQQEAQERARLEQQHQDAEEARRETLQREQQRRQKRVKPATVTPTPECIVCGSEAPSLVPAVVLFRLCNARTNKGRETPGSIDGSVCAHHDVGEALRRDQDGRAVSRVEAIMPQMVQSDLPKVSTVENILPAPPVLPVPTVDTGKVSRYAPIPDDVRAMLGRGFSRTGDRVKAKVYAGIAGVSETTARRRLAKLVSLGLATVGTVKGERGKVWTLTVGLA